MPIIGPDPETSSEPGPCESNSQSGPCGTSDSTAIEVPKDEFQDCESGEVVDYNGTYMKIEHHVPAPCFMCHYQQLDFVVCLHS